MLSASYVRLVGLPVVAKKTGKLLIMTDNQDRWPEPVFSTLSAGLAWIFFNGLILSAAFAWTFFCGLVAASIGTFLYFSYWFISEIVDNGR
jgi:hypothetical protein